MQRIVTILLIGFTLVWFGCASNQQSAKKEEPKDKTVQCPKCGAQFKIMSW